MARVRLLTGVDSRYVVQLHTLPGRLVIEEQNKTGVLLVIELSIGHVDPVGVIFLWDDCMFEMQGNFH